jgi:hypothetical protein
MKLKISGPYSSIENDSGPLETVVMEERLASGAIKCSARKSTVQQEIYTDV